MKENVGILHPGEMGISIAVSAQNTGHPVFWASDGRSPQTRMRAERYALEDVRSLAALCETCSLIFSICPPHAAEELAQQVSALSFKGLYVDANAISPQRTRRIGEALAARGIEFVDGGIIGGPAWEPGNTWLYLSGGEAHRAASCLSAGPLETEIMGDKIGQASALKMCYAAYTKGSAALLGAVIGAAESLGVREELESQWSREDTAFADQAKQRMQRVSAKAWRFAGEMDEIAATFSQAGMPDGFHLAAADIYRRLADFKGQANTPALEEVLTALLGREK